MKKDSIILHDEVLPKAVKFGLSMKCSPNKRNYMWIPVDDDHIHFWVISKIKNENLRFVSKYISFKFLNVIFWFKIFFRLKNLYVIIFVYVGLNLLRQKMFGQTVRIWYTFIPRPDLILIIIDAIYYARYEKDTLK